MQSQRFAAMNCADSITSILSFTVIAWLGFRAETVPRIRLERVFEETFDFFEKSCSSFFLNAYVY